MDYPSNALKEIKEILESKLYDFKIKQNPELKFKSLLNEIEKLKIPFPLFQRKGYLIDLSFLNIEKKKFHELKDIIKEDKINNNNETSDIGLLQEQEKHNVFGVFNEINLIDEEKKKKEEEEKENERKIKEERRKEGEELFEHFLESINKKDDYLDIQLNINKKEKENNTEKKKNEGLSSVLGILEKTTGANEDNKTIFSSYFRTITKTSRFP